MNAHIFTFTDVQTHPETGMLLGRRFVRVFASDPETARMQMERHFGKGWGFQYADEEEAGVAKFKLTELHRDDWPAAVTR